jgi:hypothetical protein
MAPFTRVLILIGTLACSLLASDTKTVRKVDREELRAAAERYMRDNAGYVPDLRSSSGGWIADGHRITADPVTVMATGVSDAAGALEVSSAKTTHVRQSAAPRAIASLR